MKHIGFFFKSGSKALPSEVLPSLSVKYSAIDDTKPWIKPNADISSNDGLFNKWKSEFYVAFSWMNLSVGFVVLSSSRKFTEVKNRALFNFVGLHNSRHPHNGVINSVSAAIYCNRMGYSKKVLNDFYGGELRVNKKGVFVYANGFDYLLD